MCVVLFWTNYPCYAYTILIQLIYLDFDESRYGQENCSNSRWYFFSIVLIKISSCIIVWKLMKLFSYVLSGLDYWQEAVTEATRTQPDAKAAVQKLLHCSDVQNV